MPSSSSRVISTLVVSSERLVLNRVCSSAIRSRSFTSSARFSSGRSTPARWKSRMVICTNRACCGPTGSLFAGGGRCADLLVRVDVLHEDGARDDLVPIGGDLLDSLGRVRERALRVGDIDDLQKLGVARSEE